VEDDDMDDLPDGLPAEAEWPGRGSSHDEEDAARRGERALCGPLPRAPASAWRAEQVAEGRLVARALDGEHTFPQEEEEASTPPSLPSSAPARPRRSPRHQPARDRSPSPSPDHEAEAEAEEASPPRHRSELPPCRQAAVPNESAAPVQAFAHSQGACYGHGHREARGEEPLSPRSRLLRVSRERRERAEVAAGAGARALRGRGESFGRGHANEHPKVRLRL
jgi:hypothetical protein